MLFHSTQAGTRATALIREYQTLEEVTKEWFTIRNARSSFGEGMEEWDKKPAMVLCEIFEWNHSENEWKKLGRVLPFKPATLDPLKELPVAADPSTKLEMGPEPAGTDALINLYM